MAESGNPKTQPDLGNSERPPLRQAQPSKLPGEVNNHSGYSTSGQKIHFPNPPDRVNPDAATLRDQWRYAIRQYSKWYSHAWGTAILAGAAFFALGWIVKGSNPLPSYSSPKQDPNKKQPPSSSDR